MLFTIFLDSPAFWFPDVLKMTFKTLKIMADLFLIPKSSDKKDHLESVKQTDLCSSPPAPKNRRGAVEQLRNTKFHLPSEGPKTELP